MASAGRLDEPLAFERMVCEWLVEFTNLRAEGADGAITRAQRRIVDAADVDGMTIFELTEGGNDWRSPIRGAERRWREPADARPFGRQLPGPIRMPAPARLPAMGRAMRSPTPRNGRPARTLRYALGVVVPFAIDGHAARCGLLYVDT